MVLGNVRVGVFSARYILPDHVSIPNGLVGERAQHVNVIVSFYRRGELARRLAIFYAAQSIASAFSGLLAFGVFHIHTGSLADWRYLFLIEVSCLSRDCKS